MSADTIHALASGRPPSGVAVIRVSGPDVPRVVATLTGRALAPRRATLVALRDDEGEVLDEVLAIHFPAPRSFTGEDVLELHCHGGHAVTDAISRHLTSVSGLRPAEPGEFTMRAHRNGRIDLIEAERLGDLVAAETEAQRRLAVSDLGRRNARLYQGWRERLLELRALIEAGLDFADEEDAPIDVSDEAVGRLDDLRTAMAAHLSRAEATRIVREGLRVVLAGPPNAGKSSLLNALAGHDAAIVTDVPGTTRDVVEVPLDILGHRIVVADTAGLRDTDDAVERIGVERARSRIETADLVLHLVPVGEPWPDEDLHVEPSRLLALRTKRDLAPERLPGTEAEIAVSTVTGEGLDRLLRLLGRRAASASIRPDGDAHAPLVERHAAHVRRALDLLERAPPTHELLAESVRLAADEIGRITGATDIEDVYGVIFSRFCMGK